MPGVLQVVAIHSGVAVVADGFWVAQHGRDALRVDWDEGAHAKLSSAAIRKKLEDALKNKGVVARSEGDVSKALKMATRCAASLQSLDVDDPGILADVRATS